MHNLKETDTAACIIRRF